VRDVRVLVVDDHESFRRAVGDLIEDVEGFVVVASASSARQCLELIADIPVDLVLMDINMPGMNGIEASRRIAAGVRAPVVVLLSTYAENEIDVSDCGAAAYVSKLSFGPQRLGEVWAAAGSR
jgi:DNA-binding NarL/FixJ family response regulator